MKQLINNKYLRIAIILVAGGIIGWIIKPSNNQSINQQISKSVNQQNSESANQIWTCSMHPQIKMDHPGNCPICGMDLIPLNSLQSNSSATDPNAITMTENAIKLADVQTIIVKKGIPQKTIYLQGKVQADERNIAELTARFNGRIEKLFVNFTGQNVQKGEKLATIYSPELITAQKELLEAISYKESRPTFYTAARTKLKLWNLTDDQINAIEQKGEPQLYFDVLSPISGTVTMRHVAIGDYVKEGTALFRVVDLSRVWVLFDAYESDLPWIKIGDSVKFTVQAIPGKYYKAKVSFIDPMIDATTRITKVRVEIPNPKQKLKPEMFTNAIVESKIAENSNEILIPKSAILWTGKRSVVYVKIPNTSSPSFLYREIELGPEAGAFYVVERGLNVGEEIAVNGVFKIDAAAQLQGLQSMMNPSGGESGAGRMPGMNMSGTKKNSTNNSKEMNMENLTTKTMKVYGKCDMCKARIEKAVKALTGVQSAEWNKDTKMLTVTFDTDLLQLNDIHKAVAKVGHDTDLMKADDSTYNALPVCCKYRDE